MARLEANLGTLHRTTRKLTLTEDGERFLRAVGGGLESIQAAIAAMAGTRDSQPAGTLKVSMTPGFGADYVLPLLPAFVERYPALRTDWHLDNRKVDLVAEGFGAAIAGGFELAPGVRGARAGARAHRGGGVACLPGRAKAAARPARYRRMARGRHAFDPTWASAQPHAAQPRRPRSGGGERAALGVQRPARHHAGGQQRFELSVPIGRSRLDTDIGLPRLNDGARRQRSFETQRLDRLQCLLNRPHHAI